MFRFSVCTLVATNVQKRLQNVLNVLQKFLNVLRTSFVTSLMIRRWGRKIFTRLRVYYSLKLVCILVKMLDFFEEN